MTNTEYVKTYTLDDGSDEERYRLEQIGEIWDQYSKEHFLALGLGSGDRVLMVAGGAGTLVGSIAEIVGNSGHVLATDIEPRFLVSVSEKHENVSVVQHNIVTDPIPEGGFDFVHTRLLLAWLPERRAVLRKLVDALKPGGVLLVEDFDAGSVGPAYPTEESGQIVVANAQFLYSIGYDPFTGRRLPGWFREEALTDVDAHGVVLTLRGVSTPGISNWYVETFLRHKGQMLEKGLLSEDLADRFVDKYSDPHYDGLSHTMISAWGRKPA